MENSLQLSFPICIFGSIDNNNNNNNEITGLWFEKHLWNFNLKIINDIKEYIKKYSLYIEFVYQYKHYVIPLSIIILKENPNYNINDKGIFIKKLESKWIINITENFDLEEGLVNYITIPNVNKKYKLKELYPFLYQEYLNYKETKELKNMIENINNPKSKKQKVLYYKDFSECSLCFNESNGKTLWNYKKDSPISIDKIKVYSLEDDILVFNPCKKHLVCLGCIRKYITNSNTIPLNREKCFVSCISTFECNYHYEYKWFKYILDCKEYERIISLYEKYQFPGFEQIKCPLLVRENPNDANNIKIEICNSTCIIPYEKIDNLECGEIIVSCDQNLNCLRSFCYHCKTIIINNEKLCEKCYYHNNSLESFNYFFYNPEIINKQQNINDKHLLKNYQITFDIAFKQIKQILEQDYIVCPICKEGIKKTIACNCIQHCNIEICNVCGMFSKVGGNLHTHWNNKEYGCPQYFWNNCFQEIPEYQCIEGKCFNHYKDCDLKEHKLGIESLEKYRKYKNIKRKLESLPIELKEKLVKKLNLFDTI